MPGDLDLSALRVDYGKMPQENIDDYFHSHSWYDIFSLWFDDAQKARQLEPNAMVLGTVDSAGFVDTRTVLAKRVTESAVVFFTNYQSAKAQALQYHPQASVTFLWLSIGRQIRISGVTQPYAAEENQKYWDLRPRSSQIGAWASAQSECIASGKLLQERYSELEKGFADADHIPLPPNWGGFELLPQQVELWVGRTGRLHDRFRYTALGAHWEVQRLQP